MVSHAYVTYLKKIRFEKENSTSTTLSRKNTQNNSAGLKMARYLVRTSIKRLLPKKTLDTSTTPKHLDGELEKHRGCLIIIWTGLNIKIGIVQKVYK